MKMHPDCVTRVDGIGVCLRTGCGDGIAWTATKAILRNIRMRNNVSNTFNTLWFIPTRNNPGDTIPQDIAQSLGILLDGSNAEPTPTPPGSATPTIPKQIAIEKKTASHANPRRRTPREVKAPDQQPNIPDPLAEKKPKPAAASPRGTL